MGASAIDALREIILEVVRLTAHGEWKILILDNGSRRLVDSVVKEDDILREKVTSIEQIEHKRNPSPTLDAVYLLSPEPHIVECLISDIERRRYRRCFIIWTSLLPTELRHRLGGVPAANEQIAQARVLNIDFFPQESHLITFRDPWSFPLLFHPACNQYVRLHMDNLAQKIVSVCVTLGEYPTIRYYRPRSPLHEASVLCSHLARFVQDSLDDYAKSHEDFPPPSPRPRGVLLITDRTMDMFAPLLHEFTYQAMVHELLPLREEDKVYYTTVLNQGGVNEERRDMEIGEKDRIWVENRHMHMKDLLEKLVADFNKFRADNPQFAENTDQPSTLNNIKDMIAGLPQFQEGKDLYSLHLNMAQECMNIFQKGHLPDVASVEQSMATGLDEDYKKPKNLSDSLVRLLDDDAVSTEDRLRLILQYILYRNGVFESDIEKLLAHAQLAPPEAETIRNLDLLGARSTRPLKDTKAASQPALPQKQTPAIGPEDLSLSRYTPVLKLAVEDCLRGTLDQTLFPYTKPLLDANDALTAQMSMSQSSLRSAKPTWARTRPSAMEPRQRIIVFMAGGATYSESRSCYELSNTFSKDVYLATTHMLTPGLFMQQVGDLNRDRRELDLPIERPKPRAPAHLFEPEAKPVQPQHIPVAAMQSMTLKPKSANAAAPSHSGSGSATNVAVPHKSHPLPSPPFVTSPAKPPEKTKEKKRGFFKF